VLVFLTMEPFQEKVVGERIPTLKKRAALSVQANAAIDSLVQDIRKTGASPIVLTTKWIATSRVAMRLGTGKDLFLVERLVSRARRGKESQLPPLKGRTVYCCFLNTARRDVGLYVKNIIARAAGKEVIHNQGGIMVLKCIY
jgi:hypothetical protein